eukprot:PhM_4_TR5614/c0_g1_i1/m.3999
MASRGVPIGGHAANLLSPSGGNNITNPNNNNNNNNNSIHSGGAVSNSSSTFNTAGLTPDQMGAHLSDLVARLNRRLDGVPQTATNATPTTENNNNDDDDNHSSRHDYDVDDDAEYRSGCEEEEEAEGEMGDDADDVGVSGTDRVRQWAGEDYNDSVDELYNTSGASPETIRSLLRRVYKKRAPPKNPPEWTWRQVVSSVRHGTWGTEPAPTKTLSALELSAHARRKAYSPPPRKPCAAVAALHERLTGGGGGGNGPPDHVVSTSPTPKTPALSLSLGSSTPRLVQPPMYFSSPHRGGSSSLTPRTAATTTTLTTSPAVSSLQRRFEYDALTRQVTANINNNKMNRRRDVVPPIAALHRQDSNVDTVGYYRVM